MSIRPQHVLALVFLVLGGWCLFHPTAVLQLCLRQPEITPTRKFLVGCLGAQALINAAQFLTSSFTRAPYVTFALSMITFFVFNYFLVFVAPFASKYMATLGNLAIVGACLYGVWWPIHTSQSCIARHGSGHRGDVCVVKASLA